VHMRELTVEQRENNFEEVELGLTEDMAKREADRCLQCGLVCSRGFRSKES
jgi:NADPH-dependent glutamate synthase beta subunit-like oxidoreductase